MDNRKQYSAIVVICAHQKSIHYTVTVLLVGVRLPLLMTVGDDDDDDDDDDDSAVGPVVVTAVLVVVDGGDTPLMGEDTGFLL